MLLRCLILISLLAVGNRIASGQEQRLQRIRESFDASESKRAGDTSSDIVLEDRDEEPNLFGECIGGMISGWMQHAVDRPAYRFLDAPYAQGFPGWLTAEGDETAPRGKAWSGRLALDAGGDFSGLERYVGGVRLDHRGGLGIATDWRFYYERVSSGRDDQALIGDINLLWRIMENTHFSLHMGGGVRTWQDSCRGQWGGQGVLGLDWFPVDPFVLSGVVDGGVLGGQGVWHGRATAGVLLRRAEVFGGYDILQIGDVRLEGPLAGIRFWF